MARRTYVLQALASSDSRSWSAVQYACEELRRDKALLATAVAKDARALRFACEVSYRSNKHQHLCNSKAQLTNKKEHQT
eukprot:2750879-Amphidinium_carterae.1